MIQKYCAAGAMALAVVLSAAAPAAANGPTCRALGSAGIQIDGMLGDWSRIRAHRVSGGDGSFAVRCAHDAHRLYLSVNVRDGHVIRFRNTAPRRNDHLTVKLWVGSARHAITLRLFPGVNKIKPRRFWNGHRVPRDVRIEDTMQRNGWSAEVSIPFRRIRGLHKLIPGVSAHIVYADYDIGIGRKQRAFRGTLRLPGAAAQMRAFLRTTKLSRGQVRIDRLVNVNSDRAPERVVVGGKIVGVISDSFSYMNLPVRSAKDIAKVRLVDLAGRGRYAIVAQYRQYGGKGSRDVVGVWYVRDSGNIERVLAFEVRVQQGNKVLRNNWKLTRPGRNRRLRHRRRRGHDVVVTAGKATNWDEDSYFLKPSRDVNPILLPWSDDKSSVYVFRGTRVSVAKKTR